MRALVLSSVLVIGCGGGSTPAVDAGPDGPPPDADISQLDPFSFFVTSIVALQDLSGSQAGFGGDLRFGETGPGAGLRGADKLCATIAERSMPGASGKRWRASPGTRSIGSATARGSIGSAACSRRRRPT